MGFFGKNKNKIHSKIVYDRRSGVKEYTTNEANVKEPPVVVRYNKKSKKFEATTTKVHKGKSGAKLADNLKRTYKKVKLVKGTKVVNPKYVRVKNRK